MGVYSEPLDGQNDWITAWAPLDRVDLGAVGRLKLGPTKDEAQFTALGFVPD